MTKDLKAYNIFDLREIALKRVPKGLFEFMDRGTEDEVSLKNNRAVFDRIRFKTRTMVDVSKRNQDTTIFGVKHKMPLVIAPTGTAGSRKWPRPRLVAICGSSSTCGRTGRCRSNWLNAPRPPATKRS